MDSPEAMEVGRHMRSAKTLIRLCVCAGCSHKSYCMLCRALAQMCFMSNESSPLLLMQFHSHMILVDTKVLVKVDVLWKTLKLIYDDTPLI